MGTPDYFQLFGLEPKLSLDLQDLEEKFYSLSRKLHPDRFQRAAPAEREQALRASAELNDAYRTLRSPLTRAEYFLKRSGMEAGDSRRVPPELLEQVFELNEALEEMRGGDASMRPRIEAAHQHLLRRLVDADAELDARFREYDAGDHSVLTAIRAVLDRRRYISNLLSQLDRELVP